MNAIIFSVRRIHIIPLWQVLACWQCWQGVVVLSDGVLFTALHALHAARSSHEKAVWLSVCPNAVRTFACLSVNQSKTSIVTKQKKVLFRFVIPYERSFILVFREEEWSVGATASTWNFRSNWSRWSENADFQPIFVRSDSAVTPIEKVQLKLIGSSLRVF